MRVYWLEQSEGDVPAPPTGSTEANWLSASERVRLATLRFPKRRTDWLLGRWTAKRAVAERLKLSRNLQDLADVEIRAAADGAPEVFLAGQSAPVAISLSHREGFAVCAVAPEGTAVGCDLELIEPRDEVFVADYFSAEERDLVDLEKIPPARSRLVTLIWSAKESALKALRAGLRLDTRCVVVVPGDGTGLWHPLQVRHDNDRVFNGWWQASNDMVRTVLTDPPVLAPIALWPLSGIH
jgi:4'-phosphopantetheinyl transferase